MQERRLTGLESLRAATDLLQRVRASEPESGVFEAADLQWWWRTPRVTDTTGDLFWSDENDTIVAAAVFTAWKETVALDPVLLPNAQPGLLRRVCWRAVEHAAEHELGPLDVVAPADDATSLGVFAEFGFTDLADEGVDAWLRTADRPPVRALPGGYRMTTRADTLDRPHHWGVRGGPETESRLRQTSLYRDDLDLVVFDSSGAVAAYGLFWHDPTTGTGLVEPMRTEDAHQRRGLARCVITAGLERLAALGAQRVKIAWDPSNAPAARLYTSVGFGPSRPCVVATRPDVGSSRARP